MIASVGHPSLFALCWVEGTAGGAGAPVQAGSQVEGHIAGTGEAVGDDANVGEGAAVFVAGRAELGDARRGAGQ